MTFPSSISVTQFTRVAALKNSVWEDAAKRLKMDAAESYTEWSDTDLFGTAANIIELEDIRDIPQFGTPANIIKVPVYGQRQTSSVGGQPDAPDLEFMINWVGNKWESHAAEVVGTANSPFTIPASPNNVLTINGVNVTLTAGARTAAQVSTTINSNATDTGVTASASGTKLKLVSNTVGASIIIAGSSGLLTALGMTAGTTNPTENFRSYVQDGRSRGFMVALLTSQARDQGVGGLVTNVNGMGVSSPENALLFFRGKVESFLITPARDDAATITLNLSTQSDFFGPFTQNS